MIPAAEIVFPALLLLGVRACRYFGDVCDKLKRRKPAESGLIVWSASIGQPRQWNLILNYNVHCPVEPWRRTRELWSNADRFHALRKPGVRD